MSDRRRRSPMLAVGGVLTVVVALIVGVWLGGHPSWIPSGLRSTFSNDGRTGQFVQNTLEEVHRDFYRPVSVTKMANAGLQGAIASLDDPYSHYYPPSLYSSFAQETNGNDKGIGVDVVTDPKGLKITSVIPDSPAQHADLKTGELITAVGHTTLAGKSATFAARLIQGTPGTPVTLTILDGTHSKVMTLTRASVTVKVAGSRLIHYRGKRLGYLDFAQFTQGSGAQLRAQVEKVLHAGAQGLILDLRFNGGGLLAQAIKVASIFIPDGTIVSTDGRAQTRQVYVAAGGAIPASIPLVVLVNRDTASSAEIVTAALQDHGRARVIGTHTYGKGVFQEIQNLSNGGALEMTVGEFFTPSGRNLGGGGDKRGAGVTPNVDVAENTKGTEDRQLQVAEKTVAAELK
jgi:carboxyl-terminal processing protease